MRSPWRGDRKVAGSCSWLEAVLVSDTARSTVSLVARQAKRLTSTARVRRWGVPKMVRALAVRKAITTPEPGPTSSTNGVGDGDDWPPK